MPDRVRRRPRSPLTLRAGRRRACAAIACLLIGSLVAAGCAAFGSPSADPKASRARASGQASPRPSPAVRTPRAKVLAGMVVGIDPGHNGLNHTDPAYLNKIIWNGREHETCDTTGTQTAGGYTEAQFNFDVAVYLRADLRTDGARVVMTRQNNNGVGPCVNTRARMLNGAHADVAIDIHADGGPTWGRGFTVLEPVADRFNANVIGSSLRFGHFVHRALLAYTPMRISDYYGHEGYIFRDDLAGLNLTAVPKVLIECGNMTNAADAALLTSPRVQREIASALEAAIVRFLTGKWPARTGL